jgi:hypothetical protein
MPGFLGKTLQESYSSFVRDNDAGKAYAECDDSVAPSPDVEAIIAKLGRSRNPSKSHFFAETCSNMKT